MTDDRDFDHASATSVDVDASSPAMKTKHPNPKRSRGKKHDRVVWNAGEQFVDKPVSHERRDDFQQPLKFQIPNPLDLVFWFAIPILEEYNSQSLHHEMDPLLIEALSLAPTLFYACDTASAVHCLVRHQFFVKLQLKLVCDLDYGWAAATVMVRDGDRWIPVKKFLRTLPLPSMKGYKEVAWKKQSAWWKRMGKPFRFTDLSVELQKQIFLDAIGHHIQPAHSRLRYNSAGRVEDTATILTKGTAFITEGTSFNGSSTKFHNMQLPDIPPVNQALLALNKATREVALEVLWADTTKRYTFDNYCPKHMPENIVEDLKCVPTNRVNFMRRIQLAFPLKAYAKLFGCPMPPITWESASAAAYTAGMLKDLPNLQYFELYFESAAHCTYSPWHSVNHSTDRYLEYQQDYPELRFDRIPCHKIITEWIMTFAAKHLLHIPTVALTGFIKTCVKKKWERLINAKSTDHDNMIKQTLAWLEEEKEAIRALPLINENFPPHCSCPKRCGSVAIMSLDSIKTRPRPKPEDWKEAFAKYHFDHEDTGEPRDSEREAYHPWYHS